MDNADADEDLFQDTIEGPNDSLPRDSLIAPASVSNDNDITVIENSPAKSIEMALSFKESGNKEKDFQQAIDMFTSAVEHCPLDDASKDNLAIFYGNRAACYAALEEYNLVISDCTSAVAFNPCYVKVLYRRSQAYEALQNYEDAIKDLKAILELDPSYPKVKDHVAKLEKLQEAKVEKMKDEALGKLKELGNSILGNFGMSLDNFKMNQDPSTGSWNISMK